MPWYSEKMIPMGRWSPQKTPDRPLERLGEGQRVTLRRVRELQPDEAEMGLEELRARAEHIEAVAWEAVEPQYSDAAE